MSEGEKFSTALLAGAVLIYVWVALYFRWWMPRRAHREAEAWRRHDTLVSVINGDHLCKHTSVPWPVMAGGELVAWLCGECQKTRPEFKCPPIRYNRRVLCEHPEVDTISSLNGFTTRFCHNCGMKFVHTEELEAMFVTRGESVPLTPLTRPDPGQVNPW